MIINNALESCHLEETPLPPSVVNAVMTKPDQQLGSVFSISFIVLTLLGGWPKGRFSPCNTCMYTHIFLNTVNCRRKNSACRCLPSATIQLHSSAEASFNKFNHHANTLHHLSEVLLILRHIACIA